VRSIIETHTKTHCNQFSETKDKILKASRRKQLIILIGTLIKFSAGDMFYQKP
jgi:hypothetical protein